MDPLDSLLDSQSQSKRTRAYAWDNQAQLEETLMRVLESDGHSNEPSSSASTQESPPRKDSPFQTTIDKSLPTLFQAITTLCQSAQMVFGIQNGPVPPLASSSFSDQLLAATQQESVVSLIDQEKMSATQQSGLDDDAEDALLWMRHGSDQENSDADEPELPDEENAEEPGGNLPNDPTMSDMFESQDDSFLVNFVTPRFSSTRKRNVEFSQASRRQFKTPSKKTTLDSTVSLEDDPYEHLLDSPRAEGGSSDVGTPDGSQSRPNRARFVIPQNDGTLDSDGSIPEERHFTASVKTLWSPDSRYERNDSFFRDPPRPGSPSQHVSSPESIDLGIAISSSLTETSPPIQIEDALDMVDDMDVDQNDLARTPQQTRTMQFGDRPPLKVNLSKTMWEHGAEVMYKEPYFSKDEDIPTKPVVFAGREFRFRKVSIGKGKRKKVEFERYPNFLATTRK